MPGVFKSHAIRITLGHEGEKDALPTIRPGTVVYGEVGYRPPSEERLTALTVNLLGKLVVKGAKGKREVTQVFSVAHPIMKKGEEARTLAPREYVFPFNFIVPWATEYDHTGRFGDDPEALFTEKPHRVPPSLGPNAKGDAQVLYSIYAVGRRKGVQSYNVGSLMDFPSGEELENIQCVVEVPDVAPGPPADVERELAPPVPKTGGLFRRASVASVSGGASGRCVVRASGSAALALGQPFALTMSVAFDEQAVAEGSQESWQLSVKSLELISTTYRRLRDVSGNYVAEEAFSVPSPQVPMALQLGETVAEVVTLGLLDLTPSFKSYTISRAYKLRINLTSSLGGGGWAGKSGTQEACCVDLPIEVIRQGDSATRSRSHVSSPGRTRELLDPPSYEGAPAYSQ